MKVSLCRPQLRLKMPATTSATCNGPASSRIWTQLGIFSGRCCRRTCPPSLAYSLAFRSVTCYEVGGDYLDIVEQPDGSLLIAVADVAGKGSGLGHDVHELSSGISRHGHHRDTARRTGHAHERAPLAEGEEARRRYVTAIFCVFILNSARIEVVNAGHNPGFLVQPGGTTRQFEAAGTPLGLIARYALHQRGMPCLHLERGCCSTPMGSRRCFAERKSLVRKDLWTNFRSALGSKPMLFSMHCGQQSRILLTAARRATT